MFSKVGIDSKVSGATIGSPRLLMLFRGTGEDAHPGVADGCRKLVDEGTLAGASIHAIQPEADGNEHSAYWHRIIQEVRHDKIDIVVLYHYHSPRIPDLRIALRALRALPHRPVVALTNGDPFYNNFLRPSLPRSFMQAAEEVDVVFSSSMGSMADHIWKRSGSRVALLPLAACQARFAPPPAAAAKRPEFRVAFIGSANKPRNPTRKYFWLAARRERLVKALSDRFGEAFGLFGNGWEGVTGWQGPVPFAEQNATCRRAEVIVGGVPFSSATYYASNRPFNQIMSGVPFVDLFVPGVEHLLRDGEHWHLAHSIDEVVEKCHAILASPRVKRDEFGMAAAEYVAKHHTDVARLRSMVATLRSLRIAIRQGVPPPPPDLRFFLPEVDRRREFLQATRGWTFMAANGGAGEHGGL